jgi:hypothetical protein
MSFAIDALMQLRQNAISQIAEYNRQIADIDELLEAAGRPGTVLEKQEGTGNAPAPVPFQPPAPQSLPAGGVAMTTEEIQEARAREARERQGLPEPGPVNPPSSPVVTAQENAQPRPWEQQAAEDAAPPAPAEPKKGGRRTNEEIAADHGVKLEDVKAWIGPEGGRVTAGKIKEFAELHPDAVAHGVDAYEPTLTESVAAPTPPAEPVRPPEPTADVPPAEDWEDADDAPVVSGAPGWDPFATPTSALDKPPF